MLTLQSERYSLTPFAERKVLTFQSDRYSLTFQSERYSLCRARGTHFAEREEVLTLQSARYFCLSPGLVIRLPRYSKSSSNPLNCRSRKKRMVFLMKCVWLAALSSTDDRPSFVVVQPRARIVFNFLFFFFKSFTAAYLVQTKQPSTSNGNNHVNYKQVVTYVIYSISH